MTASVTGLLLLVAAASLLLAAAALAQRLPPMCSGLCRSDGSGHFVSREDLLRVDSALDGDDLLALVDRTPAGALPPDYAPDDLVDVQTMRPARWWECTPPRKQCLRAEAARGLRAMIAAMGEAGHRAHVSSAFRAYRVQCSTFMRWAGRGGFCAASTASALPGHSQHQLGTAVDLFSRAWMDGGDKFRTGFGCAPAGRWIAEHAPAHGFVLPYPLHPDYRRPGSDCAAVDGGEERIDPRTGYRYEPWHLRYIGPEQAARFVRARADSGPGTPAEITLEQFLRARRGEADAVGAPVCDGCNCDRCATFASASAEQAPCARPALVLGDDGAPRPAAGPPRLLAASLERSQGRLELRARVRVPQNTLTQPPVVTPASGASFRVGSPLARLPDRPPRRYRALPGTWRLAAGFDGDAARLWQAALVAPDRDGTANGLQARIAAAPGELELVIPIEGVPEGVQLTVGLRTGRTLHGARRLRAP